MFNLDYFLFLEKFIFSFKRRFSSSTNRYPSVQDVLESPYIFVLSTGRCGTALLSNILNSSNRLFVRHDPINNLEYVSSLVHSEKPSFEQLKYAILASRFESYFLRSFKFNKIYVETNNRITFFASALSQLLPNSKFIHLVRCPYEFVTSGLSRGYYSKNSTQYQRLDIKLVNNYKSLTRVEKISWEWNEINKSIESFKSNLSSDRYLFLKSDSLFKDRSVINNIFDFINVNNPYKQYPNKLEKLFQKPTNANKPNIKFRLSDNEKQKINNFTPIANLYNFEYF